VVALAACHDDQNDRRFIPYFLNSCFMNPNSGP
jgi:hypothetical protein